MNLFRDGRISYLLGAGTIALILGPLRSPLSLEAAVVPGCPTEEYVKQISSEGPFWGNNGGSNDGEPVFVPIVNAPPNMAPMLPCQELIVTISISRQAADPQWPIVHATVRALTDYSPPNSSAFNKTLTIPGANAATLPDVADGKGHPLPGTRGPSLLVTMLEIKADANVKQAFPLTFAGEYRLRPREGYNRGGPTYESATALADGSTTVKLTLPQSNFSDKNQYYQLQLKPQGTLTISGTLENHFVSGDAILNVFAQSTANNPATLATLVNNTAGKVFANSSTTFSPATYTNNSSNPRDVFLVFRSNSSSARISASDMTVVAQAYQPNCLCEPSYHGDGPAPPGQPWVGTRSVFISEEFDGWPRDEIEAAIQKWNDDLAEMAAAVVYTVVENGPADIQIFKADIPGSAGAAFDDGTPANDGRGTMIVDDAVIDATPERRNLLAHVILHEFGHVLDHNDVSPNFQTPTGNCTIRDTIMFDPDGVPNISPVGKFGPFPGLTCADYNAVNGIR